jgi:hypothetical protein
VTGRRSPTRAIAAALDAEGIHPPASERHSPGWLSTRWDQPFSPLLRKRSPGRGGSGWSCCSPGRSSPWSHAASGCSCVIRASLRGTNRAADSTAATILR